MRRMVLIALVALLAVAIPASAAEQTRETYLAAVEPICKTDSQASDHYLKGVSGLVKHDKLHLAGADFTKAAAALEKAQKQLTAVLQPPADTAKLTQWLAGIKGEVALMRQIAAKLKTGDKATASRLAVKLEQNATKTNNLVISFEFNYCKIEPSKYT